MMMMMMTSQSRYNFRPTPKNPGAEREGVEVVGRNI